jgi:hypothetical protein
MPKVDTPKRNSSPPFFYGQFQVADDLWTEEIDLKRPTQMVATWWDRGMFFAGGDVAYLRSWRDFLY